MSRFRTHWVGLLLPLVACVPPGGGADDDLGAEELGTEDCGDDPCDPEHRAATALELVTAHTGLPESQLISVGGADVDWPMTGASGTAYKFIDAKTGQTHPIYLGETCEQLDAKALTEQERALEREVYGSLDRTLHEHVLANDPNALHPVTLFVHEDGIPSCAEGLIPEFHLPDSRRAITGPLDEPPIDSDIPNSPTDVEDSIVEPVEIDALPPTPGGDDLALTHEKAEQIAADIRACRFAQTEALTEEMREVILGHGFEATPIPGVPAIAAELPGSLLHELAYDDRVDSVHLRGDVKPLLPTANVSIGSQSLKDWNVTGLGADVGVIEIGGQISGNPPINIAFHDTIHSCPFDHANAVTGVITGSYGAHEGVAPDTDIWLGGSCNFPAADPAELADRASASVAWGADVLNLSWGHDSNRVVDGDAKIYDNLVFATRTATVASAGNEGAPCEFPGTSNVTSPATGYNVITVGNYQQTPDGSWPGSVMSSCSSYVDPLSMHGDREKPDVSAPGDNIETFLEVFPWIGYQSGTSISAPMVSGTAALHIQRDPQLRLWPEGMKALLMAAAEHNVEGASHLSDLDGAGGIAANRGDDVYRNLGGDYSGMFYNCSTIPAIIDTIQVEAGKPTRVAMAWSTETSYPWYASQPSDDLELLVIQPGPGIVGFSTSWDNTSEIVEFVPAVTGTHYLAITSSRCDSGFTNRQVAWAWTQHYEPELSYRAHVQNLGWLGSVAEDGQAGTVGQSLRMEALQLSAPEMPPGTSVRYQAHVEGLGWLAPVQDGQLAGTTGQHRRMEAVKIWLTNQPTGWGVEYRAYVQNNGWTPWVENGAVAGTTGQSLRMEALQVRYIRPRPQ